MTKTCKQKSQASAHFLNGSNDWENKLATYHVFFRINLKYLDKSDKSKVVLVNK